MNAMRSGMVVCLPVRYPCCTAWKRVPHDATYEVSFEPTLKESRIVWGRITPLINIQNSYSSNLYVFPSLNKSVTIEQMESRTLTKKHGGCQWYPMFARLLSVNLQDLQQFQLAICNSKFTFKRLSCKYFCDQLLKTFILLPYSIGLEEFFFFEA